MNTNDRQQDFNSTTAHFLSFSVWFFYNWLALTVSAQRGATTTLIQFPHERVSQLGARHASVVMLFNMKCCNSKFAGANAHTHTHTYIRSQSHAYISSVRASVRWRKLFQLGKLVQKANNLCMYLCKSEKASVAKSNSQCNICTYIILFIIVFIKFSKACSHNAWHCPVANIQPVCLLKQQCTEEMQYDC